MKKRLLYLGIAASMIGFNANAQLALENFNHGGALPTGWTMISDGHTVSTSFTGITALQTDLDANAWYPWVTTSGSDYQMLTTSYFSPAAQANRWLITPAFSIPAGCDSMVFQWDDYDLNSGESIDIKVSPTASTSVTAAFTSTLYSAPAAVNALTTHQVLLSSWMGAAPITIAFRDTTDNNWGLEIDNVQTSLLFHLDMGATTILLAPFGQVGTSYPITGNLHNYGVSTVSNCHLNYQVTGGSIVTTALTGLTIPLNGDYTYTSGTNWTPSAAGSYTIKVWADNINGGSDANHTNDTATTTVVVVTALQTKRVLVEEFNQASCDPCAEATPNLDSVYVNNLSRAIMVRYHVDFPGRDCMDSVTLSPFVQSRLTYYNVSGVPDAQVDGQYCYPGAGYFTSSVVNTYATVGSPMTITVAPVYVTATQTYSFTATIKSFGDLPAGLKAYAALTIDTITYAANQSTESIAQTMFPEVAENMFPAAGNTLAAFTSGSTQTVTGSWTKNHPWGSDRSVWAYDSTLTGKIVVWVENDAEQYVYQAGFAAVATGKNPLSVNAVTGNAGSMDIYPNPAGENATVALTLTEGANVKMEVYNVAGQLVYSTPTEFRNSGSSLTSIDVSNFASGEYFVKVAIGSEMLTKTLSVIK